MSEFARRPCAVLQGHNLLEKPARPAPSAHTQTHTPRQDTLTTHTWLPQMVAVHKRGSCSVQGSRAAAALRRVVSALHCLLSRCPQWFAPPFGHAHPHTCACAVIDPKQAVVAGQQSSSISKTRWNCPAFGNDAVVHRFLLCLRAQQ